MSSGADDRVEGRYGVGGEHRRYTGDTPERGPKEVE